MAAYTNHSIDLMEDIARATDNRISMSRRGYALVTRRVNPKDLIDELYASYGTNSKSIRIQEVGSSKSYQPPVSADWRHAPDGVDVHPRQNIL